MHHLTLTGNAASSRPHGRQCHGRQCHARQCHARRDQVGQPGVSQLGVSQLGVSQHQAQAARGGKAATEPSPAAKGTMSAQATGTVLGTAGEIPVGGGKIFTAAKVIVTQPVRGQYLGSALYARTRGASSARSPSTAPATAANSRSPTAT